MGNKKSNKVKKTKCWEFFKCKKKDCPAYKSEDLRCWLFSGTHCRDEIQGNFAGKMEMCTECEVFKKNKEFRRIVNDRDREMQRLATADKLTMNSTLREIYDGFAETYEEKRGIFDMTEVFNSFYGCLEVKKGRLLDIGCGVGEPFARFFIDRGWTVTGVDFSKRMLELASKYFPEMQTIYADMRKVKFERSQFDAITAIYSLFHVPSNDHAALFDKFYQWLCPKGKALFTYATKEYTGSNEFDGYKEFMGQKLYYSHKSPDKLYADLENIGFNIESTDYRDIGNEIFLWVTVSKPMIEVVHGAIKSLNPTAERGRARGVGSRGARGRTLPLDNDD